MHITQFPVNHPRKTIAVFALVTLAFAIFAAQIKQSADVSVIVDAGLPQLVTKNQMEAIYGDTNFAIISIEDDAFSQENLAAMFAVTQQLESDEKVRKVTSVFNTQHIEGTSESFEVTDLLSEVPKTAAEIAEFKKKIAAVALYRGNLLSLDGNGLGMMVEFVPGTADDVMFATIHAALEAAGKGGMWAVSGLPIINTQIKAYMDSDFQLLMPLFFLFIIIVLYLSFRTARGVIVPLLNIIFSIVLTTGAMAALNIPLNVVTNVIPMVLIAITSSYGIHYLSHFFAENRVRTDKRDVIVYSTKHALGIVILTGLTTFLAFMTNALSEVKAVREFGIFVAIGVAASVVATLILTPAVLALMKKAKITGPAEAEDGEPHTALERALAWLGELIITRPSATLGVVLVVLVALGYKISSVEADYTALGYFEDDSAIVTDAREVSRQLGGINGFEFDLDTGREEGILRSDVLRVMDEFSVWMKQQFPNDVKVTLSFADYVKEMNKAYNGGDPAAFAIPNSDSEIYQYVEIYSWSGDVEEDFRNVVTPNYRRAHIHGRFMLHEHPDGTYNESSITDLNNMIRAARDWLDQHLPDDVTVTPFGVLPMWKQVQVDIIDGQIQGIYMALAAIFVIVAIAFRSAVIGAIGLIPVASAVVAVFGVMGWTGIYLEIGTSLVAAMAIGIGIDDTIYFLMIYRSWRAKVADASTAMRKTFVIAGKAILYTSFALMAGYGILTLSNFKVIQYFAILNFVAIVATTLGALVLLPLIMQLSEKKLAVKYAGLAGEASPLIEPERRLD